MLSKLEKERNRKIIDIVRQAIVDDQTRRGKFKIGDQYNFIPEKLQAILKRLEDNLDYSEEIVSTLPAWHREIAENEQVVFIYLYNAQGKDIHVWERLLSNNSFAEQCFSRPIYVNQSDVEKVLRSRGDIPHHAFMTVIVKKNHILNSNQKDLLGAPLVRLAENSLKTDNIIEFCHLGKTYYRDYRGRLVLKEKPSP
jgi:hypothetical protein